MVRRIRLITLAIATAATALGACKKAPPVAGVAELERARELEARAEVDDRRTREEYFDQARALYAQACEVGMSAACDEHRRLNATLRERRGECEDVESCRAQGIAWLPEWRGEQRLSNLCWGRQVEVIHTAAPPAAAPDGAACVALGDSYAAAGRNEDAAAMHLQGCRAAHYAPACRGAGYQAAEIGSSLAARAEKFDRGCKLEDAASCVALANAAVALHEELFGTDPALRIAIVDGTATQLLEQAKIAAQRGCVLGDGQGCELVVQLEGSLADIAKKAQSGCVFLAGCAVGEVCNTRTGSCEGPRSKGAFYAAYESGMRAFDRRKYGAAQTAFAKARDMVPTAAGPWRWLGLVAEREQRWADCVAALDEALRLNPRSSHARAMQELRDQCAARVSR